MIQTLNPSAPVADTIARREAVFLAPGEGRAYPMGRISAVFKSFVLVPGGVRHDFENRESTRAGPLNLSIPGELESHMPDIAQWFLEKPPKSAGT